ncbi:MAG: hypothetical protein ABII00_07815 [Elusimicrobiota bacterium]
MAIIADAAFNYESLRPGNTSLPDRKPRDQRRYCRWSGERT